MDGRYELKITSLMKVRKRGGNGVVTNLIPDYPVVNEVIDGAALSQIIDFIKLVSPSAKVDVQMSAAHGGVAIEAHDYSQLVCEVMKCERLIKCANNFAKIYGQMEIDNDKFTEALMKLIGAARSLKELNPAVTGNNSAFNADLN